MITARVLVATSEPMIIVATPAAGDKAIQAATAAANRTPGMGCRSDATPSFCCSGRSAEGAGAVMTGLLKSAVAEDSEEFGRAGAIQRGAMPGCWIVPPRGSVRV